MALPKDVPAEVSGRIEQMRRLVRERPATPLATWLRQMRGFIPVGWYARQNPEGRGVARIDQVLAAFRRAVELGSTPPLTWLLEQRDRARETFDPDFGEDVSVTDESMAAVRVMTIHKAKGLQGKFVIVFGWQKALDKLEPKATRDRIFHLTDRAGKRVCGFRLEWGRLRILSPRYGEAKVLNEQYEAEEAKRLTYVAVTRAENRLVLLSPHTEEVADVLSAEGRPVPGNGETSTLIYGDSLTMTVIPPPERITRAPGGELRIRDGKAYTKLWRARLDAVAGEPEPLLHKPSSIEQEAEKDEADLSDYVRERIEKARAQAMAAGTLVHRYLERHLTNDVFDATKLEQIVSEPGPRLWLAAAVERAKSVLTDFYGGEYHQRACRARIEAREAPLLLRWQGKAWSGVMDLVLSESGTVQGVDYKVMQKPKQLPAEYEQQQRVYTEALRRIFPGRKVGFEFWWLAGAPACKPIL
jgi:ATP-dependent exoDNAse (exonuclease V) beta subunit